MTLKSHFLSSVRPFFDATDDARAAAAKEREKIKVEKTEKVEEKKEEEKVEDDVKDTLDKENEKTDEKEEDESDEGDEKDDDDKEDDKDEKKELTAEQKSIAKLERTVERLQKRVGKTVGERDEIRKQLGDAQKQLNAKVADGEGLTEEEVTRRAKVLATQLNTEQQFEDAQKKIIREATKIDKDFTKKVNEMADEIAQIPSYMVGILDDLENGGAVIAYLVNNVEEYEDIHTLSPVRMATKLSKLSEKLIEEAKPKPKKISKVPAPLDSVKGGSQSPNVLPADPTKNMEKFIAVRKEQVEQRRKAKLGV